MNLIFSLLLMGSINSVAVLPEELSVSRKIVSVRESRRERRAKERKSK